MLNLSNEDTYEHYQNPKPSCLLPAHSSPTSVVNHGRDFTRVSNGNNLVAYWGIENIEKTLAYLLELGAMKNTDIHKVGGNIRLATVFDPFGNIFGIIENPQFKIE